MLHLCIRLKPRFYFQQPQKLCRRSNEVKERGAKAKAKKKKKAILQREKGGIISDYGIEGIQCPRTRIYTQQQCIAEPEVKFDVEAT